MRETTITSMGICRHGPPVDVIHLQLQPPTHQNEGKKQFFTSRLRRGLLLIAPGYTLESPAT